MARLITEGWETAVQQGYPSGRGGLNPAILSADPNIKRSGNYSLKLSSIGSQTFGGASISWDRAWTTSAIGRRTFTRFWLYITGNPTGSAAVVARWTCGTGADPELRLESDGSGHPRMRLWAAATNSGLVTGALPTNTWFRVEVDLNGTTFTLNIDGVQAISTASWGFGALNGFTGIIPFPSGGAQGVSVYMDDLAINDDTTLVQNSFPPAGGSIIALRAASDNSNTGFTDGAGGTGSLPAFPNASISNGFTINGGAGSNWASIDEDESSLNSADFLSAATLVTTEVGLQDITFPAGATTVTRVDVVYSADTVSLNKRVLQIALFNGATQVGTTQSAITVQSSQAWRTVSFTGLSLTQSTMNNLSVRFTWASTGGGSGGTVNLYAAYAKLTFNVSLLYTALDNTPLAGKATPTALSQIKSVTANATDNYQANLPTYTAAGVPAGASIDTVTPHATILSPGVSGQYGGGITVVSNPVGSEFAITNLGPPGLLDQSLQNVWDALAGAAIDAPGVTVGTAPVIKIRKANSANDIHVSGLWLDVEYSVPQATVRTATNGLSFTDSAVRAAGSRLRVSTDTLTFTDSSAGNKLVSRTAAESLTLSDTAGRAPTLQGRTAAESLALTDSALRAGATRQRTTTESLTLTDAATGLRVSPPRTVTETLTLSDEPYLNPANASGVAEWLKASAITSLSDGQVAATLPDSSSNARDATVSALGGGFTGATFKTGILNGKPVLRFGGSNGYETPAFNTSPSVTLYAVIVNSDVTFSFREIAVHAGAATWVAPFARVALRKNNSSKWEGWVDDAGVDPANYVRSSGSTDALPHVLALRYDGTTLELSLDGVVVGSKSRSGGITVESRAFTIGSHQGPGEGWIGDIAEVLYLDHAAVTSEHQGLLNYLATEYGFTYRFGGGVRAPGLRVRPNAESLTFADSAARAAASRPRTTSESLTFSDTATGTVFRPRTTTEALSFSESDARAAQSRARTATETLALTEAASRTGLRPRALTESLTFAEIVARTDLLARTSVESLTFAETPARAAGLRARAAAETLTFADSASAVFIPGTQSRTASETLSFAEVAGRLVALPRSAAESLTFAESATRGAALRVRTVTEGLSFADTAARAATSGARAANETLTFSDTAVRGAALRLRTAAESLTFAETAARAPIARTRTAVEVLTFADSAVRAPTVLARTTVETLTFAESTARGASTVTRTVTEALTFIESAARSTTRVRTSVETITFTQAALRPAQSYARTAVESLTLAETVARITVASRAVAEALTFSEVAVTAAATRVRSIAEALTLAEVATRGVLFTRTAAESLTFAETLTRTTLRPRAATDTLSFSDTAARGAATRQRAAAEALTFSETTSTARIVFVTASESLAFSDSINRGAGLRSRTATDTLSFTESATRTVADHRTAAETLTLADSAARGAVLRLRTASDQLAFTDTALRAAVSFTRAVPETITFNDSVSSSTRPGRVVIEVLAFSDSVAAHYTASRLASETLTFSDSATRTITSVPTIVTITSGPTRTKISKVVGYDLTTITWGTDLPFEEYVVAVVPTEASPFETATPIPALHGSVNVAGSGLFSEADDIETSIEGADLELASAGDGDKIVRVFARRGATWSGS